MKMPNPFQLEPHTLLACFFQSNQYSKCSWMPEHITYLTKTLAGRFLERILTKKTLKPVVLGFFYLLPKVEQKLHNTLRLCYEIESFSKNSFLWKITKLTFSSSFVVNEFFWISLRNSFGANYFTCLSLLSAWCISLYKVKGFLVNIC